MREAGTRAADDLTPLGLATLADGKGPVLLRLAAQERALRQAALRVSAGADEDGLLRTALEAVSSLLQVDAVAVCLISGDEAPPRCRALRTGSDIRLLSPDDAPVETLAAEALRREEPCQRASWAPPEGKRYAWAAAVPVSAGGGGLGALIAARDRPGRFREDHVSLLCELGQHLALALLRLRERSREQELLRLGTEFVSMASHEIRTPLTALQGFTELLLSREVSSSVQRDWLSLMNREAARLGTLIGEMLDLTRIELGRVQLKLTRVRLEDMVRRVVRLLDGDGGRVRLRTEDAPEVLADEGKLAQVLTNLLRNALDYSPAERPVDVVVSRHCLARGCDGDAVTWASRAHAAADCEPAASVAVGDQGLGMAREELARATQPFYRGDASADLAPEGSGLGLAIAKAILERHQGSLWARSHPDQGSTFGFCLPLQTSASNGAA